jgi:hypothetical protein
MVAPVFGSLALLLSLAAPAMAQSASSAIEPQPFVAQTARLEEALGIVGSTLKAEDRARLDLLRQRAPSPEVVDAIQRILDPYVLALVDINPESRVRVSRGQAPPDLVQNGWRSFLVKIRNQAGVRAPLQVTSPNSAPLIHPTTTGSAPHALHDPWAASADSALTPGDVANRFVEIALYQQQPMMPELTGEPVEYGIIQIYSKDAGSREVRLNFSVGEGTEDLGSRSALDVVFHVQHAVRVILRVKDDDGTPTMASFIITDGVQRVPVGPGPLNEVLPLDPRNGLAQQDKTGHVDLTEDRPKRLVGLYPLPSRRLAMTDEYPDFYFQPQIYRQDGEHVLLAPGTYEVEYTRGPEYLIQTRRITVPEGVETHEETFQLRRWIDLSAIGWHSSDHHVHAAGCSHYQSPEEGVDPEAMWRQLRGEDLDVAEVLSWGPGWEHQKQFFTGREDSLSTTENVMRYDVEVSGFPSSHAGHLVLLGLKEDDYPGTRKIEDWPSWTLPILEWTKKQGGVTGYAHSGRGLEPVTPTTELPNYVMPRMDGIGANEYVVAITKDLVDIYSAGDTQPALELNMWYHSLNAGFRTRIMGETDFPCIFDERIGMGRTYAKVDGPLTYSSFLQAAKAGRSYVSDGKSHIIDFKANGLELGTRESELRLRSGGDVTFTARVSAFLPEHQDSVAAAIAASPTGGKADRPHWSITRARIGTSRRVAVELVVNGYPVERREIEADGSWQDVRFTTRIDRSSWAALRVFPSSHSNPIFVLVGDRPIRASRRSAEWLRGAVDQAWKMKAPRIRDSERAAAELAYDQARRVYDRIIAESPVE